jgi:hypothetical protein
MFASGNIPRNSLATVRGAWLATVQRIMPDDCWNWPWSKQSDGYGLLRVKGVGVQRAHRVMYERLIGPIPVGLELDHLCRNRACVNPLHLDPVTTRENILRGDGMAAQYSRRTSCKRGHPVSPENIQWRRGPRGQQWRGCKPCVQIASANAAYVKTTEGTP